MQTFCLVGDFGLGNRTHRGEWRWGPSLMLFRLMALLVAIGPVVVDKKRKATLGLSEWQQFEEFKKHQNRRHSNK